MRPIIEVNNLAKQYQIGAVRPPYQTLRESFLNAVRIPFQRRSNGSRARKETIWALKDVTFQVNPGEAVGIIGRNGAGKSTLLKILSQITEPTHGTARIYGRVGSLLEVGTGFHPELTGRENTFLNGAILGMKRAEIARKFDEIVAFSEVEKFIDTPVKWYSSGMYLRLAFSVAAHFEPEILIVDEVLAVGDARFQSKCLNKMRDVGMKGRAVLFVSHSISAITRLCPRTICLEEGRVVDDGPSSQIVSSYMSVGLGTKPERTWQHADTAPGDDVVRLSAVRVRSEDGGVMAAYDIRKPVRLEMEYEVLEPGHILVPIYHVFNEEGVHVFPARESDPMWDGRIRPVGRYATTAWIPGNFLAEGTFLVSAAISTMNPVIIHFHEHQAVAFQVVDSTEGDSARGDYGGPLPGVVRPKLRWTTDELGKSSLPLIVEAGQFTR
ncbi:MAG TPA: ABC transporter ATP-binding protein [Pyrinomonadaceae bacterium]